MQYNYDRQYPTLQDQREVFFTELLKAQRRKQKREQEYPDFLAEFELRAWQAFEASVKNRDEVYKRLADS